MAFLQIEDLTFCYPQATTPAVRDVSMQVEAGEFVLLCGASGCGKTTLLRLIQKALAPFGKLSGRIAIDGGEAGGTIGFVQQNPDAQIVTDKVWHELAFGLENLGLPTSDIRRRVAEMAGYFGIQDWYRRDTATLSGGQKQLLNLASVMVMQPKLLILDEPTSQLDPIAASEFISTLYKLNRETGVTVVISEHRLEEVFPKADKVAVMDNGALIAFDTPRAVGKALSRHPIAQAFPAAVRIFTALKGNGECPLTVRDGQAFLRENYADKIGARLEKQPSPMPTTAPMLSVKKVYFRYARELPDVLRGCDLQVHKGEIFSLLGGNGAGKTTLLNVLAGLSHPYSGRVEIDGKRLKEYKSGALYRGVLGLLPQDPLTLFFKDTVAQDFAHLLKSMDLSSEEQTAKIEGIAAKLGIADLLEKHPYDLSGGEVQRCALAKLLLRDPKIFLLDEPTKGLDAVAKRELGNLLRSLAAEGRTVLMVTHDIEFAATVSDRCALCFDGEILATDTPNAFFSQNYFYTTAAARISRGFFTGAVLCDEVIALCKGDLTE